MVQSSTVGTEQLVTPSWTAVDTPAPTAQNLAQRQQVAQNNALLVLQAQMARDLGSATGINPSQMTPAILQGLMIAAKNGSVDPSNAALQQFKNLLMLQQQQKQGQAAVTQSAPAVPPTAMPSSASTDQLAQAALSQQKQSQGPPSNGPTNVAVPAPPPITNRPTKLWSGDVTWILNNSYGQQNCTSIMFHRLIHLLDSAVRIAIDTFPYSPNNPQDVQIDTWPPGEQDLMVSADLVDLRIGGTISIAVQELQNYAKVNRTPCVVFVPAMANTDPPNTNRYHQFVNGLSSKGTVGDLIQTFADLADGDHPLWSAGSRHRALCRADFGDGWSGTARSQADGRGLPGESATLSPEKS